MKEIKVGMKAIIANSKNYAEYNFQMCEIKDIENSKRIQVELHDDEFITNFYVQANEIIPILYENPEDLKKWGTTVDDIAKLFSEYKGYYDLICKVADDISHESDEKDKKLERLKEEKFRNESIMEKYRKDFRIFDEKIKKLERNVDDKNCQVEFLEAKVKELEKYATCSDENVSEMNHKINRLKDELEKTRANKVELPTEPIKVAEMLIYAAETRENSTTGKEYDKPVYDKWQLEQIARHLLVYCGNSEDGD